MGDTIWVDVQGRLQDECLRDNSTMLRFQDQLDRLCEKLTVRKLSDFYEYSEVEAQYFRPVTLFLGWVRAFTGIGEARSKNPWSDPRQALASVIAIQAHLADRPEDLGFEVGTPGEEMNRLIDDLKHCRAVLEDAISRNRQFRFLIVP